MLLSTPTNILIQEASFNDRDFGQGSALGKVENDIWQPGRDGAGRVNLVSWNAVPRLRWVQVASTRLDSLDASVKAAIPGWRDWGVEGWSGVTDDWNGMAIDQAGSRLWLMGGGHAGSTNNGIYRFDALRMTWAIEDLPSDPTPWSESYRKSGSYGSCGESDAQYQAKRQAGSLQPVNDWYYDELYWDRKPTSRHTYSFMVFVPETNELVLTARRLWRYSLTERRWTYKRLIRDVAPVGINQPWMDGENGVAIYDEATREVLASAAGSSGIYHATGYSLTQNQWTDWVSPWNLYSGIADVRVGRRAVIALPPVAAASGRSSHTGKYWDYNLDTRSVTQTGQFQFADGLTQNDFAPADWFYDSASLAFIPSSNRFWLFTLMATGAMALLEVNQTTTPWTLRRMPSMAGRMPTPGKNLERKMVFLPGLNAVLLCDTATRDLYLYRL